jgi:hypothetical protein
MDDDFVAFLRGSIRSVWNVELLMVLARDPEREWTPDDLVRELRASDYIVRDGLKLLQSSGLVGATSATTFAYLPASEDFRRLVEELGQQYRERPQTLASAIFAPEDKLRTLANAFRLKKD